MIEAREIRKAYGGHTVLDGASLTVSPGECVVLTGDNGSGKTTLLHVLVGLRRVDAGRIVWKDQHLTGASPRVWRRARESWGFLPQQLRLPPAARVGHLLDFCAGVRGTGPEPALRWLERVGLGGTETQRVESLSGGMQQRLGIALTVFFEPDLIVMDEPASNLDPGWRSALVDWTEELTRRGGAVLVTSQGQESWGDNTRFCHAHGGRITEGVAGSETKL
jgi:ABC-type multidrug transport system ATPase subunit